MVLTLYFHPFSSFCQKVLIALYEGDIAFEPHIVDLGDEKSRAEFAAIWPLAKFPVLRDEANERTIPESTVIIEYLARHHPGAAQLIPADRDAALEVRRWDRFFDLYLELPMQKIVGDRLRAPDSRDPHGVSEARALLRTAYGLIEAQMAGKMWGAGDAFTMADCAAAPALFYADLVEPFGDAHPGLASYFARLLARPSFARVIEEARPYRKFFPQ